MEQIIVTTQAEMNVIPVDYKGLIIIKGLGIWAANRNRVEAWGNSSVVARGNSSVVARDNSSVVARDNSSVVARGNVQIVQYSHDAKLAIKGNARIVSGWPINIENYIDLNGIEVRDGRAILYKAVRDNLSSYHDPGFLYTVGEQHEEDCDTRTDRACSSGLHVSHLAWAIDFGRQCVKDFKILECAVPIDKIVLPEKCDGKVRTSELTVLREVPPEEWGVMGKILGRA